MSFTYKEGADIFKMSIDVCGDDGEVSVTLPSFVILRPSEARKMARLLLEEADKAEGLQP